MVDVYQDRAIATWQEYANSTTPDQCPEGDSYYRLWARKADATHGRRGDEGLVACCEECERCDCWCNSLYAWGSGDSARDASFSTKADKVTMKDMTVTISGVSQCDDPEDTGPEEDCWDDLNDHWSDISPNDTFTLAWSGKDADTCLWEYSETWDVGDFTVCAPACLGGEVTLQVRMYVYHQAVGAIPAGAFYILGEIHLGGACTVTLFTEYVEPDCSAHTTGVIPSSQTCPGQPLWNDVKGGTATGTWTTNELQTPDHWTATFSGEIVACDNAATHHATACPQDAPVEAAILQLKDPSGIVIYNTSGGARCAWASPFFQVRGYPTWYLRTGLTLTADGAETTWKVWASIRYLGHPNDEGSVGGIPGLKYNCKSDRDEHYFFLGEGTTDEKECDSPPAISNDLDCDDAHSCDELADGHDNCEPCGSGGAVSLVGG